MPTFTVSQAGPDIEPGVYPVQLTSVTGPKTVTAQRGPKAGQDIDLFDWTFQIEGLQNPDGTPVEIDASTSTASGPRSKMYSFLTALLGGTPPKVGQAFNSDQLIGMRALATVSRPEDGWPRIENLSAMPKAMLAQGVAQATGAPFNGVPAATPTAPGLREQVGDLPF